MSIPQIEVKVTFDWGLLMMREELSTLREAGFEVERFALPYWEEGDDPLSIQVANEAMRGLQAALYPEEIGGERVSDIPDHAEVHFGETELKIINDGGRTRIFFGGEEWFPSGVIHEPCPPESSLEFWPREADDE